MNYFCPKESDWKLFRKLVPIWQENYMERLLAEYQKIINENNNPSTRFWKLNDRMMNDKKSPGVLINMRRSKMYENIEIMLRDKVINYNDLAEFSEELRLYFK